MEAQRPVALTRRSGETILIDGPGAVDTENRGCTSESWTDRTFPDREISTNTGLINGDYGISRFQTFTNTVSQI